MLAVPCVERSGRQRSAKPTRFVVWPASNTIFTCVNVAATQSCTPCSSLSMSKGVKLGSCWYSLFSTQHFSKTLYRESACTLNPSSGQSNPMEQTMHALHCKEFRSALSIYHYMEISSHEWGLKQTGSHSGIWRYICQCPVLDRWGQYLRHFWESWNPSWTAHAFRHTRHHTQ